MATAQNSEKCLLVVLLNLISLQKNLWKKRFGASAEEYLKNFGGSTHHDFWHAKTIVKNIN